MVYFCKGKIWAVGRPKIGSDEVRRLETKELDGGARTGTSLRLIFVYFLAVEMIMAEG